MKREFAALSLTAAAILFFGHAILWNGASPFRGDIPLQFYPWKCYTRAMLASGEIPYWNPYTFGGAPFLANLQSAVFYPLDLILFLFPMEWFFGLSLVLHLLLAGIGAYLLARICGATPFPSIIAGIAYGLNGFTMIHIPAGNHLTYAGAAWVPWMLWATAGFVTTKQSRLPWALGGTFITCMHFLCGHPQMMFYSLVFSCLFCLALSFWMERFEEQSNYWAPLIRTFLWPLFLLLGIALCGAQLIPTLQYIGEANRASGLDLNMATEFSFAPHRLITLLCPDFYGTMIRGSHYDSFVYWSCAYAGLTIPFLALAVLLQSPKRFHPAIPLAIVAFSGLLLAWGRGNPFYALIYQLPGFGLFRAPAKYLPYYLAPVCALAVLGVEYLGNRAYEKLQRTQHGSTFNSIRASLAVVLGLALVGGAIVYGIPFLSGLSPDGIIQVTKTVLGLDLRSQFAESNTTNLERVSCLERLSSLYRMAILVFAGLGCYWIARLTPKAPRMVLSLAVAFVLFLDLYYYGQNYLNASLVGLNSIRASTIPPVEIGTIRPARTAPRPDRVLNRIDLDIPNVFMHWRLYNIAGYDPMSLKSYNRQIGLLEDWKPGDYHDNIQLTQVDRPVLDLLNVRYILTREELKNPALSPISAGKDFRIYERRSAGRSWAMTRPLGTGSPSAGWQPADSQIEFKTYSPHEIVFLYSPAAPVQMRVAEWDYPGWRAEAILENDSKVPLAMERSLEGLRTFNVSENTQEIRLFYSAPWGGWILTGASGSLFIGMLLFRILSRTDGFLYLMQRAMGRNF